MKLSIALKRRIDQQRSSTEADSTVAGPGLEVDRHRADTGESPAAETSARYKRAAARARLRRNSVVGLVMAALAGFVTIWLDILAPERREHVLDRRRGKMPVRSWTVLFGSAILCGLVAGIVLWR